MGIGSALTSVLVEEYPEFLQAPKTTQKQIIKNLIKTAVDHALNSVKLPPMKDPYQRKKDEYHYLRSSKHFRETHKIPNYDLLQKLYKLRLKYIDSDGTDFLNFRKIDTSSIGRKFVDILSNTKRDSKINFDNYSENELRTKTPFFKMSKFDDSIFDSTTNLRNHITRSKFTLLNHFNTNLIISQESSNTIEDNSTHSKTQKFTEDLFVLYDLQAFLHFIMMLESASTKKPEFSRSLSYAYEVLNEYYFEIFKTQEPTLDKEDLVSHILQNDDFRNLSEDNPLIKGFTMILSHSIDVSEIIKELENS